MLKGFKDFILRGNVIELATAVIVGAAFTGIVTAFTTGIINPLLAAIPTGQSDCGSSTTKAGDTAVNNPVSVCGLGFKITDNQATFLDFGGLIAAIINFLIVAAVIYFIIIVPYNKLASLGKKPDEAEATEISLLTEIRDYLAPEGSNSAAKEQAQSILPPHLSDPSGPPTGVPGGPSDRDPGSGSAVDTTTKRISTPPAPYSDPAPSGPFTPPERPGQGPGTTPYPGPGSPTPSPAPGIYPPPGNYPSSGGQPDNYPAPGNYPPGNYPPPGQQYPGEQYPGEQYPGDYPPDGPGRHSR